MSALAENASISASSALMSCEALQSMCNEISVKFGNEISNVVAEQLPLLSGNLIDAVSGAISNDMSALSSGLENEVAARLNADSTISGWISRNFANSGEHNDDNTTTFKNSLSAANGISVDGHSYASNLTASTLSVELSDFTCHVNNEICTLQDIIDNATAKLTPEQMSQC